MACWCSASSARSAGSAPDGDVVLKNIMAAAKESGRTFAIEYDISGGNPETFAQTLKDDWPTWSTN